MPLTIAQGRYIGVDVETWVTEGLVDFVTIGGGYVPFSMPTAEIATICRKPRGSRARGIRRGRPAHGR